MIRLLLLLMFPLSLSAQWFRVSKETPVRFGMDYLYAAPLGNTRAGNPNSFVYGQAKNGNGFELLLSVPLRDKLYVSLSVKHTDFALDLDIVKGQLYEKFDDAQHYTNPNFLIRNTYTNYLGLDLSYLFHVGKFDVMPTLGMGWFNYESPGSRRAAIERKRQNSNYTETIDLTPNGANSIYMGGGVRIYRKLFWVVDFSAGVFCLPAKVSVETDVVVTDYMDNTISRGSFSSDLSVTSLQLEAGLRFRAWRGKKAHTE
ncbi:MAG: hypothetical protein H6551_04415 [Chitinophagales bacterium]|nr:hypothetical protein [Chitinophagaceae bacterium]MCB9064368.1 hypothetical protein [Chitinophagales bacterium]